MKKRSPKKLRRTGDGILENVASEVTSVPRRIRILRAENYHTHYIGRLRDGTQFMGFIVGVPTGRSRVTRGKVRWYSVLHRFDSEGKHLSTDATFLGMREYASELNDPKGKLKNKLARLGPLKYCDIEVNLFSVRIDGIVFGLVDASVPKENYQRIDLVPNGLAFFPPWDGTYET